MRESRPSYSAPAGSPRQRVFGYAEAYWPSAFPLKELLRVPGTVPDADYFNGATAGHLVIDLVIPAGKLRRSGRSPPYPCSSANRFNPRALTSRASSPRFSTYSMNSPRSSPARAASMPAISSADRQSDGSDTLIRSRPSEASQATQFERRRERTPNQYFGTRGSTLSAHARIPPFIFLTR